MQATLDAYALKPFTKALTCLSKYGDDLSIYATPETLSISATNSSMSAYCRFKYDRQFFSKFKVGSRQNEKDALDDQVEEVSNVTGQLLTKSLLSILKHRTVEKTVDRCELSIVEGTSPSEEEPDEDRDTLESMLIVRLHCKHGIVKTHRLLLLTLTSFMTPGVPDVRHESRLTIGARAVRDIIEHFPPSRGPKSDPQLIWNFGESEVEVKSLESSIDAKGQPQLSTELAISADEFDVYNVHSPPITIAFHLREFNATVAFAESMSLPLDLRFTDPAAPLFIDVEGDSSKTLFVISTSMVHEKDAPSNQNRQVSALKRKPEQEDAGKIKKTMKAVQRADPADVARAESSVRESESRSQSRVPGPMPPPSSYPPLPSQNLSHFHREPLFLPGSSQLSVSNEEALRASGLGIENMGADELTELLEGEGEEVNLSSQRPNEVMSGSNGDHVVLPENEWDLYGAGDSFELMDETEMVPTQAGSTESRSKTFRPLFED